MTPPAARSTLARRVAAVYAAVCLAMWPVPVLGLLHAESSAVTAGVGCLTAAVTSAGAFGRGAGLAAVARVQLGALAVPLALLTASLLWRPNCGYAQGLGLFLTLVPPSVLFGTALAWAASGWRLRWPRATMAAVVVAVALAGVLWDLLRHPQLFTYSHVFGGVLGPVYDAELAVRPGLWAAKAQTLLWSVALVAVGTLKRTGRGRTLAAVAGAALAASYALAGPLGIVQTPGGIERVLSATVDLGPVVLHLDPATTAPERRRLADEALYRFETLSAALGVRPAVPIAVYLYPDADTKAALIGSRETSVVPVWLPTPQVHMLADQVPRSLGHELVHVLAREFGAPVLRASPAVGLVEGLAVALEPPDGLPSPAALVRAGAVLPDGAGGLADPGATVRRTMSPVGFWTSRAGVAYTANGAFSGWLLRRFGAARFRRAYRTGRFQPAYGVPLATLADEWAADLGRQPVDPEAVAVARWRFSQPSLFEVRCPHHVPPAVRLVREGREAWERGDRYEAEDRFYLAVQADSFSLPALEGNVSTGLVRQQGVSSDDLRRARALADSLPVAAAVRFYADARRLGGERGDVGYQGAAGLLAPADALGRLLLRRRDGWAPDVLRAVLSAPPDSVPDLVRQRAPVTAALMLSAADRPDHAWDAARRWCVPALAAGPDSAAASERARTLRWVQARLAYRAGAWTTSAALLDGLAGAFERGGPRSYAPLVRDAERQTRWRAGLGARAPAIFAVRPAAADALAPSCPADRAGPARGRRVRAPAGRADGR